MRNLEAKSLHVLANPEGTPMLPIDAMVNLDAPLVELAEEEANRLAELADGNLAELEGSHAMPHPGPAVDLRLGHNVRPTL